MKPTSNQIVNKSTVTGATITAALETLKNNSGATPSWDVITGKPPTFPPETHTHSDKQDTLVSGGNIKTINGESILGSGNLTVAGGGEGGVTDHGLLSGLGDDDHTQYHTNARGDARYSALGHGHAIADVTGLQTAIDGKQATLVSGTSIKTVNGNSLLGSGDITISGGGGGGFSLVVVSGTTQTAASGSEYALTNADATTLTGPASASAGDRFAWSVCNGRTDNVINWNGLKHENISDATMTISGPNESGEAVYINATYGWKVK